MKISGLITLASVALSAAVASAQTSTWVFSGPDGRLRYASDPQGDRIMDFSFAGYKGGGVALPVVAAQATVTPASGDSTAAIQAAIDAVSQLAPDASGFRGAVVLAPGSFDVSGTLTIAASGVVLRGSGSGPDGTILNTTGDPHLLFSVKGTGSWQTLGSPTPIADAFVPAGTMSLAVVDASSFSVGDRVLVNRTVTKDWIHFMNMDILTRDGKPQTWIKAGTVIRTDRTITGIDGNTLAFDAPLTDSFDMSLLGPTGGSVVKYAFPGRLSQIGIEHLSVVAPALNADISLPQYLGVGMSALIDAWVLDVRLQDTQNTFQIATNTRQLTLQDVHINHTVPHTGDRMADFGVNGTQVLVDRSSSDGVGEWPFVTQGEGTGPSVVLNFSSTQQAGIGPHQRWYTGLLADNCTLPNAPNGISGGTTGINFSNRGNAGSGQGWAVGWAVAWNATTPHLVVQDPPGVHNWCIGCIGRHEKGGTPAGSPPVPDGIFESLGTQVTPASLYLAQLKDRLGNAAIANIGYGDFAVATPLRVSSTTAGGHADYAIEVTPSGVFSDSVGLSVAGLPTGASASFSPASIPSGSSTLTVTTAASTPPGVYPLTLTGTAGNLSHAMRIVLVIWTSAGPGL
jgi:hypothetical protein